MSQPPCSICKAGPFETLRDYVDHRCTGYKSEYTNDREYKKYEVMVASILSAACVKLNDLDFKDFLESVSKQVQILRTKVS